MAAYIIPCLYRPRPRLFSIPHFYTPKRSLPPTRSIFPSPFFSSFNLWSSSSGSGFQSRGKICKIPTFSSVLSASFSTSSSSMGSVETVNPNPNPLLQEFDFHPFDSVTPDHVPPGIRALLKDLESQLEELEATVEPSWPKLVVPLEKLVDKLAIVWGMINHLKAVKDIAELRSAIEEVQV